MREKKKEKKSHSFKWELTKTAAVDPVCGQSAALLRGPHPSELRFSIHILKKR